MTASGADAYLLHVTTTPSVAYIARVDDFDCGIMISASHNPYYDNGFWWRTISMASSTSLTRTGWNCPLHTVSILAVLWIMW